MNAIDEPPSDYKGKGGIAIVREYPRIGGGLIVTEDYFFFF